jgi:hypothetical protein
LGFTFSSACLVHHQRLFARHFLDLVQRAIDRALRRRLLAAAHDDVDQMRHQRAAIAGVRGEFMLL